MATVRILYWQDVPAQIKVEDAADEVSVMLPDRFQARIDQVAAVRGLQEADDYLAQWHWGEPEERPGSAADVAEAVRLELEAAADF